VAKSEKSQKESQNKNDLIEEEDSKIILEEDEPSQGGNSLEFP